MTIDELIDEGWNECIACGAVKVERYFCQECVDSGVPEQLPQDNPILHRHDRDSEVEFIRSRRA